MYNHHLNTQMRLHRPTMLLNSKILGHYLLSSIKNHLLQLKPILTEAYFD
jgi:hypothetical protein